MLEASARFSENFQPTILTNRHSVLPVQYSFIVSVFSCNITGCLYYYCNLQKAHFNAALASFVPSLTFILNVKTSEFDVSLTVHRRYYVEIKCQLDATDGFFIADLIACSTCFGHHYAHHQELKGIIRWLLPVVFRAVVFQVAGLVWS